MLCSKCGYEINDQTEYCPYCGSSVRRAGQNASRDARERREEQNYQSSAYRYRTQPAVVSLEDLPPEYKPMCAWAYVGWGILFSLPIAGLILSIVFSIVSGNINRKRFARSYLCWLLIIVVVIAVLLIIGLVSWNSLIGGEYFRLLFQR